MIIELIICIALLFLIGVLFYKHRRDTIEIYQIEFTNAPTTLGELIGDKHPIVVRGCQFPQILSQASLQQIPRLDPFPLNTEENSPTLSMYRSGPYSDSGVPLISAASGRTLAAELALDKWATHSLNDFSTELTGYMGAIMSTRVSVLLGGHGMKRSTAIYTCILVTEGKYTLSLLSKRSEEFLPKQWTWLYPEALTINDTPLVNEVQFVDVVLRPGTMLIIPAQFIYSCKVDAGFHGAVIVEYDTPISNLANLLEKFE
jgi:hypothetical protein